MSGLDFLMVLRPRLYRRRVVDKAIGAPRFYISILGLMLRFHRLIPKPVLASVAVVVALTRFLTGLFGILFIAWGVYSGGIPALFFGGSLIPLALTTDPRKPRLARSTLVVLSISGAIPSMIIGTLQSHWDVVVPRCAYSVFLGVNLPPPGEIVPNIALTQSGRTRIPMLFTFLQSMVQQYLARIIL